MLQCQQRAAVCMATATEVSLSSFNPYLMQGSPAPAHQKDTCRLHVLQPHPFCAQQKLLPGMSKSTSRPCSSFMGLLYQMGLTLLVFVLPLHPWTLLRPCPVPRQGPQLCSSLAAYICPDLHSQVLCSLIRISDRDPNTVHSQ